MQTVWLSPELSRELTDQSQSAPALQIFVGYVVSEL